MIDTNNYRNEVLVWEASMVEAYRRNFACRSQRSIDSVNVLEAQREDLLTQAQSSPAVLRPSFHSANHRVNLGYLSLVDGEVGGVPNE